MKSDCVARVVIAGGGTAGWLAAARLAAWAGRDGNPPLDITLIEAPDIPTIGVGEGTWPTMRRTLAAIGIAEDEFLAQCEASFKQGSRFDGWRDGGPNDRYFHPFDPLPPLAGRDLVAAWQAMAPDAPFAPTVSAQPLVCSGDLAPRQRAMPAYSGALNYAYHLDAGKFAALLRRHAVDRLGVRHVSDRIVAVRGREGGDIAALETAANGAIEGDLFLDCTGLAALLIGDHLGSRWIDRSAVLLNDRALAAQVPTAPDAPIASQTVGTAHEAGWIWDIALPSRRGIGCVYSSAYCDDDRARSILDDYIASRLPDVDPASLGVRRIAFPTRHRERFWSGNCLAIGLSAGFIEPLEASAIALVELSLEALVEAFPTDRGAMAFLADRFNRRFTRHWAGIVDFLKLHYALGRRDEPYWRAQRDPASVPESLGALLNLWRDQPPAASDFDLAEELFPAASYLYVLYGMDAPLPRRLPAPTPEAIGQLERTAQRARSLAAALPGNRAILRGPGADDRQESAA